MFAPKQSQRNNNTKSKQRKGGTCARVHTDIHARWCLICFVLANVSLLNRLFIFNVFTVSRNSRAKTKHVFAGHLRIVSGIGPAGNRLLMTHNGGGPSPQGGLIPGNGYNVYTYVQHHI